MNILQYRREIDDLIRPDQFKSNWPVAVHAAVHFAICTWASLWAAMNVATAPVWQLVLLAVVAGHSVACMGLCGHEIGHGILTRNKFVMYLWETFAWMYTGTICTSVHRKAHLLHHVYLNDRRDPNWRPTREEVLSEGQASAVLSEWLFPNRKHPFASAFMGLWVVNIVYQMKLLFHSLLATGSRYDCKIPKLQAWAGVAETFVLNLGLYVALWAASGFHPGHLLFLAFMNYVGTVIGLIYICTNHLLNPSYDDHVDPLELSLTVTVPRWADFVHLRFSHHNEHHLFPHAGPANYPAIREALKARFPERYNEMGFWAAYKAILNSPLAVHDRTHLVDAAGSEVLPTVLPAMNPPSGQAAAEPTPAAV